MNVKFRVFDKNTNGFADWEFVKKEELCRFTDHDNYVLLQYTGVNDINGQEIYSDDILEDSDGCLFRVYSVSGGFAFKAHYWKDDLNDLTIYDGLILESLADIQNQSWIKSCCKVIRNFYN